MTFRSVLAPMLTAPMLAVPVITTSVLAATGPSPANAGQPAPVGDAVIVNQTISGRQLNAALAPIGSGNVVVVWAGEDADGRGIFGRIVNTLGQPVGDEFPVSVVTAGDQESADVVATGTGGYAVVWEDDRITETSISARVYDAAGLPGPAFEVAPDQTGIDVRDPAISRLSDGSFIVAWDEFVSATNDGSVRARFLDSTGALMGSSFILPTDGTGSNVFGPEMTGRPGGGFVVSWDYDGGPDGLWAQAFTDAASPDGLPIEVADAGSGELRLAGLEDGGFIAVWRSPLSRAKRRRFDAAGIAQPAIDISAGEGLQQWTDVTSVSKGRAAVTWIALPSSGPRRIEAQLIAADATVADEWTVTTTTVSLLRSRIAYDAASNHLVLLWTERFSPGGDQEDVLLRRYDLTDRIFADGFESGDTSAW